MAYRNTFFRWLFLYSLTFGLTYVLKLFTYLCPETGQLGVTREVLCLLLMGLIIIMSILTGELLGKKGFLETLRSG